MRDTAQTAKSHRPLSVWELPMLLRSVHDYRKSKPRNCKERPHFPAILAFVYRNRFAVASQVQRRFKEYLPSDRTARRHLAELEGLGYIDVAPTNNTSPLWPKVYFVTRRGLKRLQQAYSDRGKEWQPSRFDRYRSDGHSARHVLHELFVTEYLLEVWLECQENRDLELLASERRSLVRNPAFRVSTDGRKTQLVPDALFLYRQSNRGIDLPPLNGAS